jgi:hypothetical protein
MMAAGLPAQTRKLKLARNAKGFPQLKKRFVHYKPLLTHSQRLTEVPQTGTARLRENETLSGPARAAGLPVRSGQIRVDL